MKLRKLALAVTTTTLFVSLYANSTMAKTATVSTDTLNLRKEASTSSIVLKLLDNGKKLEVIEEYGDWAKVKVDGITGYVSKDYIKINEETKSTEKTNTESQNTITENVQPQNIENTINENTQIPQEQQTTTVNETPKTTNQEQDLINQEVAVASDTQVSILPLINASKISNVKKDDKVTIIDEVNDWCYIQTEENNGWVRKSTLNIKIEEQTVPVSADPVKTQETSNVENTISNYAQPTNTTTTNEEVENTVTNEGTNTTSNEPTYKETPITEKTMYVNYSSIYIRKGPGTNYEIVDSLILNNDVIVTAESGDWYKVKVGNITGYIAKRLLSNTRQTTTSRNAEEREVEQTTTDEEHVQVEEKTTQVQQSGAQTVTEVSNEPQTTAASSSKGQEIVDYAKQYLGCKYVYGGSGPSTFDCSGFTMYVFKHFGVNLSHSATAQSKNGTYVAKSDLQPGDLVFFKDYQTMDGIGHCGIYIGDGNFIHASSGTGYCVKISTLLSGSYNTRYETARRIF